MEIVGWSDELTHHSCRESSAVEMSLGGAESTSHSKHTSVNVPVLKHTAIHETLRQVFRERTSEVSLTNAY